MSIGKITAIVGLFLSLSAAAAVVGIGITPPWAPRAIVVAVELNQKVILEDKRSQLIDLQVYIDRLKRGGQSVPVFLLEKEQRMKNTIQDIERRMGIR